MNARHRRSFDVGRAEQVNLIEELQESHRVTVLCDAFGLGYGTLKYQRRQIKRIDPAKVDLNEQLRLCHRLSKGSTGARTLATMVVSGGGFRFLCS
ncbi:MAG: hypothetical protein WBN40_13965 [Pseudomonadales bacterium]